MQCRLEKPWPPSPAYSKKKFTFPNSKQAGLSIPRVPKICPPLLWAYSAVFDQVGWGSPSLMFWPAPKPLAHTFSSDLRCCCWPERYHQLVHGCGDGGSPTLRRFWPARCKFGRFWPHSWGFRSRWFRPAEPHHCFCVLCVGVTLARHFLVISLPICPALVFRCSGSVLFAVWGV